MADYDAITADQWVIALTLGTIAFTIMWWLFWRGTSPAKDIDKARPAEIIQRAVQAILHWHPNITSSNEEVLDDPEASGTPNQQPAAETNQLIAKPNNEVNIESTVNSVDEGQVNEKIDIINNDALDITEAREMIRHQAKAEAIADLMRAGIITNQAKAIETVYHCSRTSSSRPDTPYQRAKQLIDKITNPQPVFYNELREKITAEVAAEAEAKTEKQAA